MAALTAEMQSKLAHHEDALRSLQWGGTDIATLRRSHADQQQVQPAHNLAFNKLVDLLVDKGEYETAHADFYADGGSADKLSRKVRDLMDDDVRICSSS